MNSSKLFLSLVFSLILISSASALTVYAGFNDGTQTAIIEDGSSVNFEVDFFSMNSPMFLVIELKDSSDSLVYTILNKTVSSNELNAVYTLNKTMYSVIGSYSVIARGTDRVGSSQYDELKLIVRDTIDTTKPVITIIGSNPISIYQGTTYTDAGATALDNIDGNITSRIVKTGTVNTAVTGTYTVYYNVQDTAGNVADQKTRTVKVISVPITPDTTAPTVSILGPVNGTTYNVQMDFFNFIATDENLNKCEYSKDNGATKIIVACTSGVLTTVAINSSEGANKWIVYATDIAGNTGIETVEFTINTTLTDTTAPVITVITPVNNKEYSSKTLTFKVTADEDAILRFSLDGDSKILMDNPYDHIYTYTITLSDNDHTVTFYATDKSGNIGTKTVEFSVDYKTDSSRKKKKDTTSSSGIIDSNALTEEELTYLSNITEPIVLTRKSSVKELSCFEKIIQAIVDFFNWLFGWLK